MEAARDAHEGNREVLGELETQIQSLLGGRISDFNLDVRQGGLVLRGNTSTYYAKQQAQQAVVKATDLPIIANEIEVKSRPQYLDPVVIEMGPERFEPLPGGVRVLETFQKYFEFAAPSRSVITAK